MAKPAMCLTILVVLAIANTQAINALLIGNQVVSSLLVTGTVCCSPNGSCSGTGPPVSNSRVFIVANNNVIAVGVADPQGRIRIRIDNLGLLGSILSIANLAVHIPLPISTCPVLSTVTGTLQGPLTVVSVVGGLATCLLGSLNVV